MDDSDVTGIHSVETGRRAALVRLVEEFQQPIGSYLTHLVGDRSAALALTEETLVSAYRARADIQVGRSLRPWLYRIATCLALRHLRDRPSIPLRQSENGRGAVQSLLRELRPGDRAVLLMCDLERMPSDDVAAALGISRERLEQRLARARARFRSAELARHCLMTSRRQDWRLPI